MYLLTVFIQWGFDKIQMPRGSEFAGSLCTGGFDNRGNNSLENRGDNSLDHRGDNSRDQVQQRMRNIGKNSRFIL